MSINWEMGLKNAYRKLQGEKTQKETKPNNHLERSQTTTQKEANNHMEKQSVQVPALVFYLQLLLFSCFLSVFLSPSSLWRWDLAVEFSGKKTTTFFTGVGGGVETERHVTRTEDRGFGEGVKAEWFMDPIFLQREQESG